MQQEQSQEQQPLHKNCTFVCITEDVNNCEMGIQHSTQTPQHWLKPKTGLLRTDPVVTIHATTL